MQARLINKGDPFGNASRVFRLITLWWFLAPPGGLAQPGRLPECEWCGADEAPDSLTWTTTIPGPEEPGERLTIRGRVFQPDGTTPAEGIILYVYHTNAHGLYATKGNETGNGRRHGYLRGWMKTNGKGEYRLNTIKPAPYPIRNEPAHLHITVKEPDKAEYWIDSFVFDDDPLLTEERRAHKENRGGSGILVLKRNAEGVLEGRRDILLMR